MDSLSFPARFASFEEVAASASQVLKRPCVMGATEGFSEFQPFKPARLSWVRGLYRHRHVVLLCRRKSSYLLGSLDYRAYLDVALL